MFRWERGRDKNKKGNKNPTLTKSDMGFFLVLFFCFIWLWKFNLEINSKTVIPEFGSMKKMLTIFNIESPQILSFLATNKSELFFSKTTLSKG